jgi:hypothetical protein
MSMGRVFRVLLGAGVALAGCSSPSDGGAGPSGPISADTAPTQFAQTLCTNMAACCQAHNLAHDDATCESSIEGQFRAAILARQSSKVLYDPDAAGRCLDAYVSAFASCGDPGTTLHDACNAIWVGTVDLGGACTQSEECKDTPEVNAYCNQGVCTEDLLGQKPARATAGEACNGTCTENGSGYSCISFDTSASVPSCYTNDGFSCDGNTKTCVPLPKLGEPCTFGTGCASGAFCEGGTCVAQRSSGPCTDDSNCTNDSYCSTANPSSGVTPQGSCTAKKPDGATCQIDQECTVGRCQNGICTPRLPVSASLCAGLLD